MKSLKSVLQEYNYKNTSLGQLPKMKPIDNRADISMIPNAKKYQQGFVLYRVKLPSIAITRETRNDILAMMDKGKLYVQVGEYTIMINSISGIDPLLIKKKSKKYKIKNNVAIEI